MKKPASTDQQDDAMEEDDEFTMLMNGYDSGEDSDWHVSQ